MADSAEGVHMVSKPLLTIRLRGEQIKCRLLQPEGPALALKVDAIGVESGELGLRQSDPRRLRIEVADGPKTGMEPLIDDARASRPGIVLLQRKRKRLIRLDPRIWVDEEREIPQQDSRHA